MQDPNHININDLKKNCNITLAGTENEEFGVGNLNPYLAQGSH